MRFAIVLALMAVCLAFVKSESSCIYQPRVIPYGGICNGGVSCQYGSYCSRASVCTPNEKVGNDCSRDKVCELGSSCKGSDFDSQVCVLDAHPGQDASNDDETTLPYCQRGYNGNRCSNGEVGDSCYEDQDCNTDKCDPTSLKCLPLANGEDCYSSSLCAPASYCDTEGECAIRKTEGECSNGNECAAGYDCFEDKDGDFTCTQKFTIADGEYCVDDEYCVNKRCYNGYCASKKVVFCNGDNDCAYDQYCNCDGMILEEGVGKCVDYPCAKLRETYQACLWDNCHDSAYFNGSCIYNHCKTEYETFSICDSASSLTVSFLSVSLAAFFVSFLSKRV